MGLLVKYKSGNKKSPRTSIRGDFFTPIYFLGDLSSSFDFLVISGLGVLP